jgi:hypothetical protein
MQRAPDAPICVLSKSDDTWNSALAFSVSVESVDVGSVARPVRGVLEFVGESEQQVLAAGCGDEHH